jgi:hypothetical protein
MKYDYEKQLEAEIDRELKGLPDLSAPATMAARVMRTIGSRAQIAWYRQAWPAWHPVVRAVALVLLVAMFGGLCFAGWHIAHIEAVAAGLQRVGGWFAGMGAVWNAVHVLLSTLVLLVKKLGTGVLMACMLALVASYAMWIGLGTVYVRLAFARR